MTRTTMTRPPRVRRVLDDDDDDEDGDSSSSSSSSDGEHARPPPAPKLRPSMRGIRQSLAVTQLHRRRRRSSARFLRLHHHQHGNEEEDMMMNSSSNNNNSSSSNTNLQELYQKAIRLNAENKINASNSWSLKLIENIDNFLLEEDEEEEEDSSKQDEGIRNNNNEKNEEPSQHATTNEQQQQQPRTSRVNFTKASCTLDASVKIYSYRVDDVHLTSYKVLANLNRSDTNQKQQQQQNKRNGGQGEDENENDAEEGGGNKSRSRATAGSTIESHLANINLNKLDSAFDIDPLFSKMSKTFDEGGAKGLLLVNLGVGAQGCNIVFDSSCDDDVVEQEQPLEDEAPCRREGMIDISSLTSKLDSLLQQQQQSEAETTGSMLDREAVMASLPLVPQLSQLRSQFAELESQGFVTNGPETPIRRRHPHNNNKRKSQFYGVSEQEEKEADRSIHQEAMERSRASMGRSFVFSEASRVDDQDKEEDEYGADDFGGGFDDDDDDDDIGFDQFIASEEARLSAISFDASLTDHREDKTTTALLDALADSPTLWATGDQFAYWNTDATHLLRQANHWAGVAHWNKKQRRAPPASASTATKAPKKAPAKKSKRPAVLVDLSVDPSNKLDDILFSSKKASKSQKLQWSQTTITKHGRNENVLPLDAGIGVEQLASLFLRPDTVLKRQETSLGSSSGSTVATKKQVGFAAGPWDDDDSFGGGGGAFDDGMDDDDNDGPGFVLASQADEDFGVAELEGVRKVEKVQVGYATVAKKVDVKRLKKDLWNELEEVFLRKKKSVDHSSMDDEESREEEEQQQEEDDPLEEEEESMNFSNKHMSFQQTVKDIEESKTQADVTLPFYFICILHLANEKGLRLDSKGLEDFDIYHDGVVGGPSF